MILRIPSNFFSLEMPNFRVPYVLQITFVGPCWLVQILLTNRIDWTPRSLFFYTKEVLSQNKNGVVAYTIYLFDPGTLHSMWIEMTGNKLIS
jgi:hypothetical protein